MFGGVVGDIRLYLKIRPYLRKIEKQLGDAQMKISLNVLIQVLGTLLQGLMAVSPMLSGKGKFAAEVAVSAVQGATAVAAHFSNPDGTKAQEPYVKK